MMHRLDIDFSGRRRASPWLGRGLLAVALAVCVDAGLTYHGLRKAVDASETRVARRGPAGPAARVSAQEVAAVRETVQRIGLPWDELFVALEAAATDKVALASIEPDTAKGTVVISGDGKDYLAALSYVSNLSRTENLERVQLVRHERKTPDPNGPVSFAVSAAWSTQ
jgi:hypothetical protein